MYNSNDSIMKKVLCSMALLAVGVSMSGQDKLVKKARALFGEQKFEEAQAELTPALTSEKTKNLAAAWDLQGDLYQVAFIPELNKGAQKQPLDTMKFAKNLYACVEAYEKCNELDTEREFVAKNKGNLKKFRTIHYYAAQFFYANKQYKEAIDAFERWLNYPKYKLVADDPSIQKDSLLDESQIVYYVCLCAYNIKDYATIEHHREEVLKYTKEINEVRKLLLEVAKKQNKTAEWEQLSLQYAMEAPDQDFGQNLLSHYFNNKDMVKVKEVSEKLLSVDPKNRIALLSKGILCQNEKKYKEGLDFFKRCIDINPEDTEALVNAGVCLTSQGYELNSSLVGKKMTKVQNDAEIAKVKAFYKDALPYFEKVRELNPDKKNLWASQLKEIYMVLGDKAKEAEIDELLK